MAWRRTSSCLFEKAVCIRIFLHTSHLILKNDEFEISHTPSGTEGHFTFQGEQHCPALLQRDSRLVSLVYLGEGYLLPFHPFAVTSSVRITTWWHDVVKRKPMKEDETQDGLKAWIRIGCFSIQTKEGYLWFPKAQRRGWDEVGG